MLEFHLTVLKYSGVWRPVNLSRIRNVAYKMYSFVTVASLYILVATQVARLFSAESYDDFNDTFFIALANANGCLKGTCYVINREKIINLLGMLENEPCAGQNASENELLEKYDKFCRKIAVVLLSLVNLTLIGFLAAPFYAGLDARELPFKVRLPYSLENILYYWLTFAFHTFTSVVFIFVITTNNATVASFMVQVCAQLEMLQYRFDELPGRIMETVKGISENVTVRVVEKDLFSRLVKHHQCIFRAVDEISETFKWVIISQYYSSAMLICISVYQTAVRSTNVVELFWFSLFLACILGEFFVYCYFGNEISVRSVNMRTAIYKIDWTSLSVGLKKDLIFMILQSSKPLEVSYGAFVRLTLDSFVNIVKTSYSAFNMIKSST